MCKHIWSLAKINLRHLQVPYVLTGITTGAMAIQTLVLLILHWNGVNVANQSNISFGNILWLIPLMAGIFIPARNFRRIINLGGKRSNFFWGSLMVYAVLAAAVSLTNIAIFYVIDLPIINAEIFMPMYPFYPAGTFILGEPGHIGGVANLVEVFRWSHNGIVVAFFQQFAFLFLIGTFAHSFTAIQDKWYGWLTGVAFIAIISVFTPIAPLRAALVWFFNLIIFHDAAVLQIVACIVLGMVIYSINKPVLARKAI